MVETDKGVSSMAWLKSIRALVLFLLTIGVILGFLQGKLSSDSFVNVALIVFTGFFSRPKSDTNKKGEIVE